MLKVNMKLIKLENLMKYQPLLDTDMEFNIGLMEHIMKVIGTITKQKVREHFGMLKEISIEENLRMIWPMAMVSTYISMVQNIKVNSEMIYKKDKEKKNGLMAQNM